MESTSGKVIMTLIGLLCSALGFGAAQFTTASSAVNEITIMRGEIAVFSERMIHLQKEIEAGMADRYRGSDARRDFALVNQQFAQNAKQIEQNAKQIDKLYQLIRAGETNRNEYQ